MNVLIFPIWLIAIFLLKKKLFRKIRSWLLHAHTIIHITPLKRAQKPDSTLTNSNFFHHFFQSIPNKMFPITNQPGCLNKICRILSVMVMAMASEWWGKHLSVLPLKVWSDLVYPESKGFMLLIFILSKGMPPYSDLWPQNCHNYHTLNRSI